MGHGTDSERLRAAHPEFFAALDQAFGVGAETRLHRLDLRGEGGLQAEMTTSVEPRWVAWHGAGLEPLSPEADRKVPLSRWLRKRGAKRDIRILSYRPGRRLTILDQDAPRPRILKGFRKNRFPAIVAKYELAHEILAGRGVQAPEIVDMDEKFCFLAMVYDPGDPLRLSAESMDEFHLVGECLAGFQSATNARGVDDWTVDHELETLDRQADLHTLFGLTPPDAWRNLRERLDAAEESLPEPVMGLCHRDLHDKQLVRHPRYLTLLDFDLLCRADVALDAANLLAHLRLRQLQGRGDATPVSTHVCGKRLLEGLGLEGQAGFWERLRFYQATTFARLSLLYALRPRWTGLTADLTTLGHRCLDDFQRARAD